MSPLAPSPIGLFRARARRRISPRLTVGLVVGACAVVAAAVAGVGLLVPPVSIVSGWAGGLRWVGLAIVLVGAAGLAFDRPGARRTRGPDPTMASILAAVVLMGSLALISLLAPRSPFDTGSSMGRPSARAGMGPEGELEGEPPPPPPPTGTADVTEGFGPERFGLTAAPASGPERPTEADDSGLDWGPLSDFGDVLLAALVVGLLIAGRWATKRRAGEGPPPTLDDEPPAADGVAALGASIETLLAPGIPSREHVTAAYRRLLEVLAALGAGRRPHEAPLEHLARSLGPLGVGPRPMERLAELYVLAQFSDRPIEEVHRDDAAAALRSSLVALRTGTGR